MPEILAIIPARGGSKGIPRKNLAPIGGTPLVVFSIRHALSCPSITRTVCSTDDEEIASVCRQAGAEVPFMRPAELGADTTLDHPVFRHVLAELEARESYRPDLVVHLRPTAPLREVDWTERAIRTLLDHPEADSIRSVSMPSQHPYRMFTIGGDGLLSPLMSDRHPRPYELRRQELPAYYYYNCVIDVTRASTIVGKASMTGDRILPLVLDPEQVLDIDSPRDLLIARALMGSGA